MIEKTVSLATDFIEELGAIALFYRESIRVLFTRGVNWQRVIEQIYAVGVRSLGVTLVAGMFVGAIMAIQINVQLRDFGAQGVLGGLATSVTMRNVGPVLIAFILSGKVGAYTSAELGTLRVTQQLDAIRCLGADPIEFIVLPRMIAVIFSSFLLLIVGMLVTIFGGILIASAQLGLNALHYTLNIPKFVSWWSVGTGITKSFIFGNQIALICCYQGYRARGGAGGVGQAVRKTAVQTLVCIVVADFAVSVFSAFIYDLLGIEGL